MRGVELHEGDAATWHSGKDDVRYLFNEQARILTKLSPTQQRNLGNTGQYFSVRVLNSEIVVEPGIRGYYVASFNKKKEVGKVTRTKGKLVPEVLDQILLPKKGECLPKEGGKEVARSDYSGSMGYDRCHPAGETRAEAG